MNAAGRYFVFSADTPNVIKESDTASGRVYEGIHVKTLQKPISCEAQRRVEVALVTLGVGDSWGRSRDARPQQLCARGLAVEMGGLQEVVIVTLGGGHDITRGSCGSLRMWRRGVVGNCACNHIEVSLWPPLVDEVSLWPPLVDAC